jgi:hypothetical protein
MSAGNSYGGGRTRVGSKVLLNIYDLTPSAGGVNNMLYAVGLGLHHSGVEIDGVEYSFAQGAGIFEQSPKDVPNAIFRESVYMGTILEAPSSHVVRRAISDLRDEFHGDAYHLIRRNCNHFANAFCWVLLRKTIPAHVNRLADIGVCCSCLLPRKLLEESPVRAPGNNNLGYSKFGSPRSSAIITTTTTTTTKAVFSGSGLTLGGDNDGRSTAQRNATDDLTDRRERARKAALARLEQLQQQDAPKDTTVCSSSSSSSSNAIMSSR